MAIGINVLGEEEVKYQIFGNFFVGGIIPPLWMFARFVNKNLTWRVHPLCSNRRIYLPNGRTP